MTSTASIPEPRSTSEAGASLALLAFVSVAAVVPLLLGRHLPFTDLPEHVAVASALAHWNDPIFRVREHYVFSFPETPYVLFHVALAGLTKLLGGRAEIAIRIVLVIVGLGFPLSLRRVLSAIGGDRRLAIFAPLVFWNRALVIGFLPFITSIPVLVFAIALATEHATMPDAPGRGRAIRRWLLLAFLGIVLFYLHTSSFILFVLIAIAMTFHLHHGPRRAARSLLWLLPSAIPAVLWITFGQLAQTGEHFLRATDITYTQPKHALFLFPLWIHDIWKTHLDESCAILWWLSLTCLLIASLRASAAPPREVIKRLIPLICALIVYFATPHRAGVGVFLNVRLAPLLALFAVVALAPPSKARLTKIGLAGAAIAALIMSVVSAREIVAADDEDLGADFDHAIIDRMRPGARVMALNFDTKSEHVQFAPWLYAVAYYRIRKGGVTAFSFAAFRHWPLRYTAEGAPPEKAEPFWATNPYVFQSSIDGRYYDYVLVRGDSNSLGPNEWELIGSARKFQLFENRSRIPSSSDTN